MKFEFEIPDEIFTLIKEREYNLYAEFDKEGLANYRINIHPRDKSLMGIKQQQQLVSKFRKIKGVEVYIHKYDGNAEIFFPYPSRGLWRTKIIVYGIAEQIVICNEEDRQKAIEQLTKGSDVE